MARHTSLRIGGPADALVAPESVAELEILVGAAHDEGIALTILGGGANLLVGDRGIRGIVVDLRRLRGIAFEDAGADEEQTRDGTERLRSGAGAGRLEAGVGLLRARAGAGASLSRLCEKAMALGRGGLENFYAMPGSVGGSVYMNARCYEVEMSERIESLLFLDGMGHSRRIEIEPSSWSYKRSPFQAGQAEAGALILEASFLLPPADPEAVRATMIARLRDREEKGHFRLPSAGSMFKNDRSLGRPTGVILDSLGFRGRRIGDAMVSPWHANIFVNAGKASASEMLALVELARSETLRSLGLAIEPEVLFVGEN